MGFVTEVGSEVSNLVPGDRVVVPFQISRGMSSRPTRSTRTSGWPDRTRPSRTGCRRSTT
ncbi:hypothetical protein [Kribbella catacumbae]|uniref:hypothetical protein n=1 Tax=Kribbella catacumbae TaxID=460086 RepID=UPI00192B6784